MDNLQIGTLGWDYDHWEGGFYPEDMPSEWRLDYYANTFRVVLIPQQDWLALTVEDAEELIDAVEGEFSFYFELKEIESEKIDKLMIVAEYFADAAAGVIVFVEADLSNIDFGGLKVTQVARKAGLQGWGWQYAGLLCSGEPCGVVTVLSDDAKQQRAMLESFMASLPDSYQGAPFFVSDTEVKMKQLQDLKTIGEFLGY